MPLAPEYEAMFAELAKEPAPALSDLPPEDGREVYRMMRPVEPDLVIGSITDMDANGVPVRVYRPEGVDTPLPVVVFYHGGGWVIGDLDTADAACRDLSQNLPCVVVSVHYRLAPEHPFPAPVDDSYTALEWVANEADELGGNGQIVVAGESAGGNLSAVMSLRSRDRGGPEIAAQVLLYPVVGADLSRDSYQRNGEGYLLELSTMHWFWDLYVADAAERANPDASPLLAESHANLPPAIVVTAEFDPLCDEGAEYAKRLEAAGGQVVHHHFDGLVHDFFATARMFPCSRTAVDTVYGSLRAVLG